MKKTFYLLMTFIGLTIVGCQPMEEIQDEINNRLDNQLAVGDINYTLTEDDYSSLELNFPNFSSLDDAKDLIPVFLSDEYPTYGANSTANITFNIYDPIRVEEYSVAADDYAAIGLSSNFFTGMSDIQDLLEYKFPQAEEGDYVELTYRTLADEIQYTLDPDDFDLIGEELAADYPEPASSAANYSNFDRREDRDAYWSNDMILEAINVVLADHYDGVEGQKYNVAYNIYDGSSGTESMTVQFDGNSYVAVGGTAYELDNDDYDYIGVEFATDYPGPAGNAAQYNSFDVRSSSDNYWSDEMLLEAVNAVLTNNYPDATEGAKFEVTYKIYNGAVTIVIENVILSGGTYVIDEDASVSTIQSTNVYAYTNGNWSQPLMLDNEDYTEMGQSYPNFDDEDEAFYKLAIFLGRTFPYAEEGDFVAVAYNFYDGGVSTEYANFVFEGGKWMHIPSVKETSLQFGNIDGQWIPDNTIRYTLAGGDYGFIADVLIDEYPAPAGSMGRYGNFDVRSGNAAYWSPEMILEAMNVLLDEIAPNAEEGQKYIITYAVYNGSNTTETISVIKSGGEWILNE